MKLMKMKQTNERKKLKGYPRAKSVFSEIDFQNKAPIIIVIIIISFIALIALHISKGPTLYLSKNTMNITEGIHNIYFIPQLVDSLDLPAELSSFFGRPKVVMKKRVGVIDALLNLFSFFVLGVSTAISLSILCLIGFFILTPISLFTGNWTGFLVGLLGSILGFFLGALFICLSSLYLWIVLLVQVSTPAYFIIVLLAGLPVIVAIIGAALAGPVGIPVIIVNK